MHIFAKGKHNSGLGLGDAALDLWPMLLEAWLRGHGLLTPHQAIGRALRDLISAVDTPRVWNSHAFITGQIFASDGGQLAGPKACDPASGKGFMS